MTDRQKEFSKKTVTPKGTAIWPHLTSPSEKYKKYNVKIRVQPEDDGVAEFKQMCEELLDQKVKQLEEDLSAGKFKQQMEKGTRLPITEELDDETGEPTGFLLITCGKKSEYTDKTTKKVVPLSLTVVDAKKKTVKGVQVGSGSTVRASVELRTYATQTGVGVSARMNAAQILELVEYGGGGAEMFDEEDGYEAEADDFSSDSDGIQDGADL